MVHLPAGFTGPVWLAHYVRTAQALALQSPLSDTPLVPLDGGDNFAGPSKAYATRNSPAGAAAEGS